MIYNNGTFGIEEIKSTETPKAYSKAQEQLQRAKTAFRAYDPKLAAYFVRSYDLKSSKLYKF